MVLSLSDACMIAVAMAATIISFAKLLIHYIDKLAGEDINKKEK